MTLRVKYTAGPVKGMWRMAAGFAALPALSYWALNLPVAVTAQQIEHSLTALVVGGFLSGLLFLSGLRDGRRAGHGDREPAGSQAAPAAAIQRAA